MLPTCRVHCAIFDNYGAPIEGAAVTAALNRFEVYQGYVVPDLETATTDADGTCTLALWPSAPAASRRIASSRKRLSAMKHSLPIAAASSILLGACSTTPPPQASLPTPPAWLLVTPSPLQTLPHSRPSPATTNSAASTSSSFAGGSGGVVR